MFCSEEVIEKPNKSKKISAPFFEKDNPDLSTADCYGDLLSTIGQSLVEFRLPISACEASLSRWQ